MISLKIYTSKDKFTQTVSAVSATFSTSVLDAASNEVIGGILCILGSGWLFSKAPQISTTICKSIKRHNKVLHLVYFYVNNI